MKVHLFVPCLVDQAVPETARSTVKILERLGHQVIIPRDQTCCGQAMFNMGFHSEARELAHKFLRIFADAEVVVAPSGSCVSMVSNHYGQLNLADNSLSRWKSIKTRIFELTAFLVDYLKISDVGAKFEHSVSLHASCHALRELNIKDQALQLLNHVDGLILVNGKWGDECCGFGGAFSVKYPELSQSIADRRVQALSQGGAEYITGVDDSCLHHLQQAFFGNGMHQKTMHIAGILASQ